MNKRSILLLSILCILSHCIILSQPFIGIPSEPLFSSSLFGDIAEADFNGDLLTDVIITGYGASRQTAVYINKGDNKFEEVQDSNIAGLVESALLISDFDNDGDQDVIISGLDYRTDSLHLKLYFNNGESVFTEQVQPKFFGFANSAIEQSDIDNDNDVDFIITGESEDGSIKAILYINDGNGNFDIALQDNIQGVTKGDVAFSDIDQDGDQDMMIVGSDQDNNRLAALYVNDGKGGFVKSTQNNFWNVSDASVLFFDADKDGDEDLLICGKRNAIDHSTRLYMNVGGGQFEYFGGSNLPNMSQCKMDYGDLDDDGDHDLVLSGTTTEHDKFTAMYINDGFGVFTESVKNQLPWFSNGAIVITDTDNDGDKDLFIGGQDTMSFQRSHLLINQGYGQLKILKGTSVYDISDRYSAHYESLFYSDIDHDGDIDIIRANYLNTNEIYVIFNDPIEIFACREKVYKSNQRFTIILGDFDGDTFDDIIVCGIDDVSQEAICKVLINDGFGRFEHNLSADFESMVPFHFYNYHGVAGDIDNDGDNDIIINGYTKDDRDTVTYLYINKGGGYFSVDKTVNFKSLAYGSPILMDIENDGDLDLLLYSGFFEESKIYIYKNEGGGLYSEGYEMHTDLIDYGIIRKGDINSDGYIDLFVSGIREDSLTTLTFYLNDKEGNFIKGSQEVTIDSSYYYAVGDVDADGDLDFATTSSYYGFGEGFIYKNDGKGTFYKDFNLKDLEVRYGYVDWVDADGDKDLDLIIQSRYFTKFNNFYKKGHGVYLNENFTSSVEKWNINSEHLGLKIFPNPITENAITVVIPRGINSTFKVKILNTVGSQVYFSTMEQKSINEDDFNIDISSLLPGTYILVLHHDGGIISQKFVKI